ncbi:DUF378 domain-containing protein [Patescibacteria group bacterium]|nr:DUF378 domain-containing protein [Patescibacteria group bacterium]
MKYLHYAALILVIVGGLNWGLFAFQLNLVNILFGTLPALEQAVYLLVALSAVYLAFSHWNECKTCSV